MRVRLIAVGDRQPSWVETAFAEYAGRLPREWRFSLQAIAAGRRGRQVSSAAAKADESERILARISPGDLVVLLDEDGRQMTSIGLAECIADWQSGGRDVVFVIGGPDGVADGVRLRADMVWSLSALTLPHGLARVLFIEQMYRGWSILGNHPYHRA